LLATRPPRGYDAAVSAQEHDKDALHPEDGSEAEGAATPRRPDIQRSGEPEPFQLEDAASSAESHIQSLDVCPNCGSPMPDAKTLVCLRCGFDMKRLEVIKTKTGETTIEDPKDKPEKAPPLCRAGRGDLWLPGVLAAIAVTLLLLGYLAGATSLFPRATADPVPMGMRFTGLLRSGLLILIWALCGIGGLTFLGRLLERPFGDLKLAAIRMIGITAVMRLMMYVHIGPPLVDWPLQAVLQAAVFYVLLLALFGLTVRDAATTLLATLISFVMLWIAALAVNWAAASGF
jgi:hypothetical protein